MLFLIMRCCGNVWQRSAVEGWGGHSSGGQAYAEVAFGLLSCFFLIHVHFVLLVLRFKVCVFKKKKEILDKT